MKCLFQLVYVFKCVNAIWRAHGLRRCCVESHLFKDKIRALQVQTSLCVYYMYCRLDQILGRAGSKKPDVYESKISLASRIVKVERQVRESRSHTSNAGKIQFLALHLQHSRDCI